MDFSFFMSSEAKSIQSDMEYTAYERVVSDISHVKPLPSGWYLVVDDVFNPKKIIGKFLLSGIPAKVYCYPEDFDSISDFVSSRFEVIAVRESEWVPNTIEFLLKN